MAQRVTTPPYSSNDPATERQIMKVVDTESADSEYPVGGSEEGSSEEVTKDELYEKATELDIEGRSTMSKDELQKAIDKAENQ